MVYFDTSPHVERSARRRYLVESSATKKPSYRVQLQTNHPVESSATN